MRTCYLLSNCHFINFEQRSLNAGSHGMCTWELGDNTSGELLNASCHESRRVLLIFTPSIITIFIIFLMPLQSKGFTAWISIDDTELDAYNVEATNDGKKVSSWIASETGKASLGYQL